MRKGLVRLWIVCTVIVVPSFAAKDYVKAEYFWREDRQFQWDRCTDAAFRANFDRRESRVIPKRSIL